MKKNSWIKESWQDALSNRDYKISLFLSLILAAATINLGRKWLIYNESRISEPLNDWVLGLFTPIDLNNPIFFLTELAIFIGLATSAFLPYHLIRTLLSVIFIALLRIVAMYFVPLEPPIGIIPLRDPILEDVFYSGQVLVKDLFFSGHISNLLLVALTTPFRKVRVYIFGTAILVAVMLLLQHVHYTVDILVAPFFTILAIQTADTLMKFIFKRPLDLSRSGSLRLLFQKPS